MGTILWIFGLFIALWGTMTVVGSDFFWGLVLIGAGIIIMIVTSDDVGGDK